MKPLYLQFKGINSFSENTEIDFEKLTRSGIFGIFGDTGSGKSTILDCISFALYGKVERSKEKLDIINYNSDGASVKFDFEAQSGGSRKKFTVIRSIKKKSGVHKAALYEGDTCTADNPSTVTKRICEILGVNAEDFSKCIALPQGEFSQFVKSNPSERIALIERLFSLSRYGDKLKEKIRDREREAELKYSTLAAKLELYSDVSEEILKSSKAELCELLKRRGEILKESEISEKRCEELKRLDEKREELEKVIKEIAVFEEKKPQMEILRKSVAAASLFKAAAQLHKETDEKINEQKAAKERAEALEKEISASKTRLENLAKTEKSADFEDKISELIKKEAAIQALEGKPEKLLKIDDVLKGKRNEYKRLTEIGEKLNKEINRTRGELAKLEESLKGLGQGDLEKIIDIDFKGAHLKLEYEYCLDYFKGLKGQVDFFKNDGELWPFLESELKVKISEYRDRAETIRDFTTERAKNKLKEYLANGAERERLSSEINDKKTEIGNLNVKLDLNSRDLENLKSEGERERKEYDDLKSEIDKAFGADCKDYKKASEETSKSLEKLKCDRDKLKCDTEKETQNYNFLTSELALNSGKLKALTEEISNAEKKLTSYAEEGGFESLNEMEKSLRGVEFENIEKDLKSYDENFLILKSRKAELEKEKGLEGSNDELKVALAKKAEIAQKLSSINENVAVNEAHIKKCETRLTEKNALLKEFTKVEKDRNLISQLKEITRGNGFMEFIANEYLSGIASLASSTLLTLTDGRYFLKYTDTFYAGDNYNCGALRGVNTLSGGETFLVSLSLALALSKTICSSLKSVEFFFLDEGFGTLDSSLVDTVMTALEKLKGEHFTIGVISHVEELKHRINNKIIVNKSTETHGSSVQTSF